MTIYECTLKFASFKFEDFCGYMQNGALSFRPLATLSASKNEKNKVHFVIGLKLT
jgi:hypothetical protein